MADINELKSLVTFLRDSNITYYKSAPDGTLEIVLGPAPAAPVRLEPEKAAEPLPEIYKRLPANYSNPSLFPKPRD